MFTTVSSDEPTKQHIWQSTADGSFTAVEDPRGPILGRGSRVTMILKEEAAEYLRRDKVTDIVSKYSQFMSQPRYQRVDRAHLRRRSTRSGSSRRAGVSPKLLRLCRAHEGQPPAERPSGPA